MTTTPIYREMRALLEACAAGEADAQTRAQRFVDEHCAGCGLALVGEQRGKSCWCEWCDPERGQAEEGQQQGLVMPSRPVIPPRKIAPWPEKVRPTIAKLWKRPATKQLLADLAQLRITLPILRGPDLPASADQRRALFAHDAAMEAVLKAARGGLSQRQFAALLFGSVPGSTSDAVGEAIRKRDPHALQTFPSRPDRQRKPTDETQ